MCNFVKLDLSEEYVLIVIKITIIIGPLTFAGKSIVVRNNGKFVIFNYKGF